MALSLKDKYRLYELSVQNHEVDIDFINVEYERFYKRPAFILREDFGGTAAMACDWVKQSKEHRAYSIDLDSEPISYGLENHYSRLTKDEQQRMKYVKGNVLDSYDFKSDIVVAFNFSYFIFKERRELLSYFKQVREGLSSEGAFFIDLFGGKEARQELVEETEHEEHSYYWDCDFYNPITEEVMYYIHFKTSDGKKHEKVFTYDWRMWSMSELRDLLYDAGFKTVLSYWEGDDGEGGGDGQFYVTEEGENCESWVTYLAAFNQ